MPEEETPRQILFALCWRGEEGALDKVGLLLLLFTLSSGADIGRRRGVGGGTDAFPGSIYPLLKRGGGSC